MMRKSLCIFLLAIILVSCGQVKRELNYVKDAKEVLGNAEWLNYNVSVTAVLSDGGKSTNSFSVVSFLGKEDPYYAIIEKDILRSVMIKENEAFYIDGRTRELSHFSANKDDGSQWFDQISYESITELEYLSFFTICFPNQLNGTRLLPLIQQVSDTVIQAIPYRKYVAIHPKRQAWNEETNEFDITIQYASHIWLNLQTNQFDSVSVFRATNNNWKINCHYYIDGLNHDNKSDYIDSIFNFDNPIYTGYSRHTETFPPYSRIGVRNEGINDSLLSFPFIGLQHDTTTINNTKGWVLLDLWQFGCPPCYQGIKDLQHEKDSLGFSILEQEGITIIAANAKSDNLDLIQEVSEKCGCPDVLYAGKGTMSILALVNHAFPSYYLISPEKEIVWRSNYLGDYSELLEAKANYEKQH